MYKSYYILSLLYSIIVENKNSLYLILNFLNLNYSIFIYFFKICIKPSFSLMRLRADSALCFNVKFQYEMPYTCSTCLYFPIPETMNKKGCEGKEGRGGGWRRGDWRGGGSTPRQGGGMRRGVAAGAPLPRQVGERRRVVAGEGREAASQDQGAVPRKNQNL